MKKILPITLAAASGVVLLCLPAQRSEITPAPSERPATVTPDPAPALPYASDSAATPDAPAPEVASAAPVDFGAWAVETPRQPEMEKIEKFGNWIGRWNAATEQQRESLREEGAQLAKERRAEFKALIAYDPQRALEESISRVTRQSLPREILEHLETPVSATGNYEVYKGLPAPGMPKPAEGLTLRYFEAKGMSYKARVYGTMEPLMGRKEIPLRGVAMDRELAVAESPVRQLEVGEKIPVGTVVEDTCPVSNQTTKAVATGQAVTADTPTIEVGERVITLCNGSHVAVLDEKYRTLVQAAGPGGPAFFMDAFPGTSSRAIGNFRCLYIRATYPDQMAQPNTEDQAMADMKDTAKFYLDSSYGKMTTTYAVTPLVVLPQTLKWYQDKDLEVNGLGVIQSQARAEAKKIGYDSAQYDCIIVRVNGGLRNGSSWGGGDSVWLGWGGMGVINHECGHSLGLGHANYWSTSDGTPYGNGANQEYGNDFDVMGTGSSNFSHHYNSVFKRNLGWLPSSYVHFPKINGVYRLTAFDQPRLEEGKRYSLNVSKNGTINYDIEYHATNPAIANQALVLYGNRLIDTTPGSSGGKGDGGIKVGRTFSDWEADLHFTVVAINATTPPSLDLAYQRGPFPGNQAPTVALGASATTVNVGDTVTFTATANDADGDAVAYDWTFDDGTTAVNAAVVTKTFTSAAQVTAMVTVSDMKGGTTRRHVVINVGAHGKQTVTGNITAGGVPLSNVRVTVTSGKFAYTDADGNYALAGVSTGAQTLTATLNGYTLTPSFANPLTVVAGANTANWTAGGVAGTALVTLTKTVDAAEGGSNGNFRLTRDGDTTADLVVQVAPTTGTATKTTDYTFTPDYVTAGSYRTFTIPAGSATLDVAVAAVNDTTAEGLETITLQVVSGAGYLSTVSNAEVMTVADNDTTLPSVAVTSPDPYAMEPGDNGSFVFTRTGATAAALNLAVTWTGTATNGSDYATLPTTVTIPVGQSSTTVSVTAIDDSAIETPEDVIATISTNAAYVRDAGATTATVTISDDDTAVVTVSVPDATAAEAGPDSGMFLITRTGSTAAPLKVYYGLSGTAFHGTDYARLSGEVTIPAGATSAAVVITPYDDDLGEGSESVTLGVTTFNNAYSIGAVYQGTITIADNVDVPVVAVRAGTTGVEGGANATLVFRSLGSTPGNVTVNYTVSGTATAGSDYTALSGTLSLPGTGPADVTVTIPVTNDTTPEATETVEVQITPSANYRVYNDGYAEVAIRDNDSGGERVMVSAYNSSATEAGAAVGKFYVSRAVGTTGALTVNYTLSGTATSGADYTGLTGSVVIPDGQSGEVVTFTPVDDALAEGTETVILTVSPDAAYSIDRPDSATLEIADNETPAVTVGFQSMAQLMSETPGPLGEYRDITVVLSAASASPVTVQYTSGGGSAAGDDVDWTFVDAAAGNAVIPGGTLTFAPGVTSGTLRVRIKDDGVSEPAETAVLELRAANGGGLTSGMNRTTLTIFDDTIPTLITEERWNNTAVYTNQTWSGSAPNYTGYLTGFTPAQGVADNYSRRLTGQIVAPVTGAYRFWIASDDASRLYLSTDSTPANKAQIATVTGYTAFQDWTANASQQSAFINLVAGQSYYMEAQHQEGGGGDHVSVAWEGPGFTRTPITVPMPDNAPRSVRFSVAATTRFETDGIEPLLMVVLDRPAGSTPVTVDYATSGTATAGSDYTLAPGTLTFAAGEQVKVLPLTILADAIGEAPEAIVVSLSNPTGAQITAPASHTINVVDGDAPIVTTQQFNATSAMSAGAFIGTMSANAAAGRSIIEWSILSGNEGNVFAINTSGQVSLLTPSALPSPGTRQLVVRAMDNAGATGDGTVNIVCNPPAVAGVAEQRWSGGTAYDTQNWSGATNYSGSLTTFTTPQNVADSYSRRLIGYIQPQVTGAYTFWVASDDDGRLFLSTDNSAANKVQIANVAGYTGYQSWDSQASQKSAAITLQAGNVYYMEVHHKEGGGGDHASVAWQGPGISRQAIPASAMFPTFGAPAIAPSIAVTSPVQGADFAFGVSINVQAALVAGSLPVASVDFYDGGTLLGSDSTAPYSFAFNGATSGGHTLTAKAVNSGGAVTSAAVGITVQVNADPSADPDGDGFTTGLEVALGTNPQSAASQPASIYSSLRAWWKLNEASGTTADDSTGRVQDGAVTGATWVSGLNGNALSFDGTDDGVVAGASAALTGAGDFTLGAWVKLNAGAGAGMIIQQREPGSAGIEGEYLVKMNASGTVNFFVYNGGYQFNITSSATINDGLWHHVVATRSGADGRVYVDGALAGQGSGAVKALQPLTVALGYDYRDNNARLNGLLDDARIYERALSATEITQLFTDFNAPRPPAFTTNPVSKASAAEDSAYSANLGADVTDPNAGDTRTFAKVSGPAWLNVSSAGALSGTPTNSDVGANAFVVQATDSTGLSSQAGLNITVTNTNDAPTFAANPITRVNALQGSAYSGTIAGTASDVDAGDTISYSKVSGPAWLTVAADGSLGGTPGGGEVGASSWTVRATDALGATANATLNIVVDGLPLPAGWTGGDVGSVGFAGSASENSGTYTVNGSGADIWNASDAFFFASQTLAGDGEIRARVTSQTNTSTWAKAGVMIRDGTAANAAHAMMIISPGNGFALQSRAVTGGTSSSFAGPALNTAPNNWVRLTRSGSTLTAYVSANGNTWTQVGSLTIGMSASVKAGLAVTSTNNSAISTATFDNVTITPYPAPWLTSDVGATGLVGRAEYFSGAHNVTGAGVFGGASDSFRYVYQTLSGDGSIVARVNTIGGTSTNARIGVMIRDSLTANSPMASLSVTGGGAWRWARRTSTGGSVSTTNSSSGAAPNLWVRLVRSGNTLTASRSTNGTTWTTISSVTVSMAANCYIGLEVASGSTTTTNSSILDNVTVVP